MGNISIIIRVRNEEQYIGHCIQSLLDNIYQPELIVINNDSTDNSINIVKSFKKDNYLQTNNESYTDIKILNIDKDNYTPGKAINLGVNNTNENTEYIMVFSSHCILKDWDIQKVKNIFNKNPNLVSIFGNQIPTWNGKRITKRYIWDNFPDDIESKKNPFCIPENRFFLHNAFAIYPKNVLKYYPFDEELIGKEDRYWANNIINIHNKEILYLSSISCYHHYTPNGNTWKGIG